MRRLRQYASTRFFPKGPASPTLVEAVTARALNLRDGQIVQATVQSRAD